MSEPGGWMHAGPQRSEGSRLKHPLMMQTLIRKLTTELEAETRHDQVRATASGRFGFALCHDEHLEAGTSGAICLVMQAPQTACKAQAGNAPCEYACTLMQTMCTRLPGAADQPQVTAEAQLEETSYRSRRIC